MEMATMQASMHQRVDSLSTFNASSIAPGGDISNPHLSHLPHLQEDAKSVIDIQVGGNRAVILPYDAPRMEVHNGSNRALIFPPVESSISKNSSEPADAQSQPTNVVKSTSGIQIEVTS